MVLTRCVTPVPRRALEQPWRGASGGVVTSSTPTPTQPASGGRITRTLGRLYLRLAGWHIEGALPPDVRKAVVVAAPHTTNWDMPHMIAVAWALDVRPSWLGKKSLFRFPFGWMMRKLGGIPVDRSRRANVVDQAIERFAAADRLLLVIPPSGTRSRAPHWKSGFYHIARGAGVPILCSFLDYPSRTAGLGPCIRPTGVIRADMGRLREFYSGITGRYPELTTPVMLAEEDASSPRAADSEPAA
ncbi:MAG: hypothetical protein RL698_2968 [Pseudomonadota bacterium]